MNEKCYQNWTRNDERKMCSHGVSAPYSLLVRTYLEVLMAEEEAKRSPIFQKFSLAATQG